MNCLNCGEQTKTRHQIMYCSNTCQMLFQYKKFIENWKAGIMDGSMGISTKNTSRYIKKYLIEKYGEKCSVCGWKKRHSITNHVPIEMDHIDGNAENNREENLRLICSNCHALTPYFRNLNKGNGRKWRINKYIKNDR